MSVTERPTPTASDPSGAPVPRKYRLRRLLAAPEAGVGLALLALVVAFSVLLPGRFGTLDNARFMVGDASVLIVLSVAVTLIVITGNLDLSIGSIVAFCEVVSARAMVAVGGDGLVPCLAGLAVALGSGLAWGAANGFLVARARIPSFVVTLATFGIALGAALLVSGGRDIANLPPALTSTVGLAFVAGVPVPAVVAFAFFLLSAWALGRTRFGRYTFAVGSDAVAAERAGIDVGRHVIKVYALAGLAYGLAAYLGLARFSTTQVGGHSTDALDAIAAVALGGTSLFGGVGTVLGTMIGVFIPAVLENGLVIASVQPFWQQIAVGLALLAAVYADQVRRSRRRQPSGNARTSGDDATASSDEGSHSVGPETPNERTAR